ncbi:MAG: polymer-forming cytoskeletal protein, partial [Polyangiaceae bacterium]|nr:polymer-forming cytoskeletal protein [Polyangiaceae bacterium]
MFSWFKKPVVVAAVAAPTENVIAKGTRVRGDIEAELGFRIDGSVDGTVVSRGVVTIGEDGELLGNVRATSVVVLGHVEGDVVCEGHLEIGPNGRIVGDVTMKSFQIQNGGVFAGTSRMAMPDGVKALSAAPPK